MRLKTLMEEQQLDFNQPLLTVRRLSSIPEVLQARRKPDDSAPKLHPLPFYRSELKSGPVSNPGTVPFVWEQAPGRPKNRAVIKLPNHAPKLPPGKTRNPKQKDSDKDSYVVGSISSTCSEKDDESYLDALDTFSRSESFFMNCSASEIDSPVTSGRFSSDFMMDRFLPAAKAMTSEVHQSRKPNVAQELPRPIRLAVNGGKKVEDDHVPSSKVLNEVQEEDDDDSVYAEEDSSAKLCGLLPNFCLLNPVPGLRIQPTTRPSRKSRDLQLRQMSRGKDGRRLEGSNLYRRLHGNGGLITSQKDVSLSSPSVSGTELVEETEKGKDSMNMNFLELLASEGSKWGSGSMSPLVEKTLYVDSVHLVKDSDSDSFKDQTLYVDSVHLVKDFDSDSFKDFDDLLDTKAALEPETGESNREPQPDTAKITELERDFREESAIIDPIFLVPPPLPKTPSDSWLSRALDSKKSASRSFKVLDRTFICKTVVDPKWETIVKTSKVHHGHLRFSEELLPPIPDS